MIVHRGNDTRNFTFDYLFGPSAGQDAVYGLTQTSELVDDFLDGVWIGLKALDFRVKAGEERGDCILLVRHMCHTDIIALITIHLSSKGKNCTVFAYGQTGSGKTHTVIGTEASDDVPSAERTGIIPRVVCEMFSKLAIKKQVEMMETTVYVSFSEIYQETVRDLLDSEQKEIIIRENANKEILLSGITEMSVDNAEDLLRYVKSSLRLLSELSVLR